MNTDTMRIKHIVETFLYPISSTLHFQDSHDPREPEFAILKVIRTEMADLGFNGGGRTIDLTNFFNVYAVLERILLLTY